MLCSLLNVVLFISRFASEDDGLSAPLALAALPEGGLVVRTYKRLHMCNGPNIRLAWITACAVLARRSCELHPLLSSSHTRRKLAH